MLFCLLLASVLFGGAVGILHDGHRLIRILLGMRYGGRHFERLYATSLPLVHRTLEMGKMQRWKRRILPVVLFFQDIALFCFAGAGTVLLNFYYNNGRFRLYTLVGLLVGFLLYSLTVGKAVMFFSEGILFFLRAGLVISGWLISRPFVAFIGFLGKIAKSFQVKLKRTIANQRKKVYNKNKKKIVLQEATYGFLPDIAEECSKQAKEGEKTEYDG